MSIRPNQFQLLRQRRFSPFFWVQFGGAANDNIFKFACTLLVTYQTALYSTLSTAVLVNLIAALFILPFVLLSATSGQIADKFERARLIRLTKWLELSIVLLAALGFWQQNMALLLSCIFLLGVQATLFGPVKYAYLPQHLHADEIIGGNALVQSGTFVAILLGTLLAGMLVSLEQHGTLWISITIIGVSLFGLVCSYLIPASPAPSPELRINWNPFSETWRNLALARERRTVFLSMLGISWLWFFGATLLTQLSSFTKDLGGDAGVVALMLALFSIGVGVGALLCERMSDRNVEIGLVPFGSIGMSVFALDLYFSSRGHSAAQLFGVVDFLRDSSHWRVLLDLVLLSVFSGFFSVPLYALVQTRSVLEYRSRMIAANNILNAIFMVASAAIAAFCLEILHFSLPELFLMMAVLNALVALYIFSVVPEFLLRFLAWMLVHTLYTLKKEGTEKIPERGAAILICNHVSLVDAIILMGISPRPIRFVMDYHMFKLPVISWFSKNAKVIPIASAKDDPVMVERAFSEVSEALRNGDLVCIFPEGCITDSGQLNRFRPGITRILKTDPVPVIPLALCGLWGSLFSKHPSSTVKRLGGVFSHVFVRVGDPVPPLQATPEYLQKQVQQLRGEFL